MGHVPGARLPPGFVVGPISEQRPHRREPNHRDHAKGRPEGRPQLIRARAAGTSLPGVGVLVRPGRREDHLHVRGHLGHGQLSKGRGPLRSVHLSGQPHPEVRVLHLCQGGSRL